MDRLIKDLLKAPIISNNFLSIELDEVHGCINELLELIPRFQAIVKVIHRIIYFARIDYHADLHRTVFQSIDPTPITIVGWRRLQRYPLSTGQRDICCCRVARFDTEEIYENMGVTYGRYQSMSPLVSKSAMFSTYIARTC